MKPRDHKEVMDQVWALESSNVKAKDKSSSSASVQSGFK
jgi:hypothetical protein